MISKQLPNLDSPPLPNVTVVDGVIDHKECERLCVSLSVSLNQLMIMLLPIASNYSKSEVSNFKVGAVVKGERLNKNDYPNLYLGANLEFAAGSLCCSLHAEQSAISIAWHNGETSLSTIATSAMPCGHCRQFMNEIVRKEPLMIICPDPNSQSKGIINCNLGDLLPDAFGPEELGNKERLMENFEPVHVNAHVKKNKNDRLILMAVEAAMLSYAPYTKGYAGCAIELFDGRCYTGRTAENVAHNPTILALTSALTQLVFAHSDDQPLSKLVSNVKRVVLAEATSTSSQRVLTNSLLTSFNSDLVLEYIELSAVI